MRRLALLAALAALAGCDDEPAPGGGGGSGGEGGAGGQGGGGGAAAGWQVELEDEHRVALSVFGTSPGDVWAVGGGLGNGAGALATHFDGAAWEERDPGVAGTLWWVWGSGPDDVFMVGEAGTIVRWNGAGYDTFPALTDATLFGVWGTGPDDVWAVGGTPSGAGDDDVLLRFDGSSWRKVEIPEPRGAAYYKLWGTGPDDVWICGQGGLVLHVTDQGFRWYQGPIPTTLFTVSGNAAGEVWVVGGAPVQLLTLDRQADAFVAVEPPGFASVLNGVSVEPDGDVWIVGTGGVKWRRAAGTWVDETRAEPHQNLHSVFAFGDGGAVVAGGDFLSGPAPGEPREGVVGRYRP